MYQLPHRSLATNGSPYASETLVTKVESKEIEKRRLWMERADLLNEWRVLEMESDAAGKIRSDSVRVRAMVSADERRDLRWKSRVSKNVRASLRVHGMEES
jgi:hypothetical protein